MRAALLPLLLVISTMAVAPANAEDTPADIGAFNTRACAWGMAIGADGSVYVGDYRNGLVMKFSGSGTPLGTFGPAVKPTAVAIGPAGDVFVAESDANRVSEFTPDGTLVRTFGGTSGTGPGELTFPCGVAIDSEGRVHVADTGNRRIQVFGPEGAFVTQWPTPEGRPWHIAFDPRGGLDVAIVDDAFYGITRYAPDGTPLGPILSGFAAAFQFDSRLDLLVATGNGVGKFDAAGNTIWFMPYGPWPGTTCGPWNISGLALAPDGSLDVLSRGFVHLYAASPTPAVTPTWGSLKSRYR